ncbi:hypothetical protein H6G89_22520 [Oscillatoria sp. FACHB-1407]|uniref:hypothetical protein n=1 Tax=Oscillatoria sp. FACHB-1407 TaxID=2692847 RepID=UPI001687D83C|nr:hypothetical protein [Oscillatoria sp. FACHB-1407]MBD2463780.1 hypothetical protein [Oscillatoria sp. FACHB-1407]
MRGSTVVFYTLATLTATNLAQSAIATPDPTLLDDSAEPAEPAEAVSASPEAITESLDSIASPEAFIAELSKLALMTATGAERQNATDSQPASTTATKPVVEHERSSPDTLSTRFPAIAPPETLLALERPGTAEPSPQANLVAQAIIPGVPPLPEAIAPEEATFTLPSPVESESSILLTSAALLRDPSTLVAQATPPPQSEIEDLQEELESLEPDLTDDFGNEFEGSPAVTISNPSGFGADNFTGFVNFGFQSETRYSDEADGTLGFGIGLGDAQEAVGLQLSYTLASFGGSRDFGTGGLNAKLHRQFSNGLGIAVGWEGFATTGEVDFEDTVYGSITQIIRTNDDLDDPFSRIALTAGVGNGRFRSEEAVADDEDTVGVFGSVAVRVARPVSAIVEWTGQDLAVGLSITPIRGFPLVITPALRDIAGAGDGARFVLGTGISFQF